MNLQLETIKQKAEDYRSIPFWSWNDILEDDVLKWQIHEMAKVGCGGYFMHARGGIETDYLGDEWFHKIGIGVTEGIKAGMKPWVYDECGWPSGFASGKVTAKGEAYHAKGLEIKYIEDIRAYVPSKRLLGLYTLDENMQILSKVALGDQVMGQVIAISYTACPDYIDILNQEVVAYFLECTHQAYYQRFGEDFGKGIQGFFTDEPRISEGDVPWSLLIPETFMARYGYDITLWLPALFVCCEGYEKVRYDFWSMVSDLFVDAFMKQIYEWCEAHNCQLTGHVMMEESLYSQMTGTAGSMPFYEYMHIPGVDWLRRTIGNSIMAKQVASVADQLGKRKVLTESFALCGWNVTLEELKWIAEWQYANGVNVLCQHLEGYTLRGLRKRDYPPSLFFQQNWWEEYKDFNDYLARLGATLTEGQKVVDMLVIHPMQSAYIAFDGNNNQALKAMDQNLIQVTDTLIEQHVDYHFGDEKLMAKYAQVKDGALVIGECAYHTVVLPSVKTLTPCTLKLLDTFCKQGGVVVCQGDFPEFCDGEKHKVPNALKAQVVHTPTVAAFKEYLTAYKAGWQHAIQISGQDEELTDIRYMERQIGEDRLIFMLNLDKQVTYPAEVTLKGHYTIKRLQLDGEMMLSPYRATCGEGVTTLEVTFEPMQSYLFIAEPTEQAVSVEVSERVDTQTILMNQGEWQIKEMTPNTLTLDKCRYRIDHGNWEDEIAVIHLMKKLLALKKACYIEMDFSFMIDEKSEVMNQCYLIAEEVSSFAMTINGQTLIPQEEGWWKDTAFRKVPIHKYLKVGENHICMARDFYQSPKVYHVLFDEGVYETEVNQLTYDVELESVYLLGDFGVESASAYELLPRDGVRTVGPFTLVKRPQVMQSGDFTQQGLCFFSGKLMLQRDIQLALSKGQKVVLDFDGIKTPVFKVWINGEAVAKRMWAPFKVEITDYVKAGSNQVIVEIYSSNRNLLGPHHHIDGEIYNVGPLSFSGEWSWCERETEGVEINKADKAKSYWRDDYCFVRFGF